MELARLERTLRAFRVPAEPADVRPHGAGHIHDTFAASFDHGSPSPRYILQRINRRVFRDVPGLMSNIFRVTEHVRARLAAQGADCDREALTVVPTTAGALHWDDAEGDAWRVYRFVEGSESRDAVSSPEEAFEAARAFGRFAALLDDFPPPRLRETIPGFHDTPKRLERLEVAARKDPAGRAASARAELEFVRRRAAWAGKLQELHARGELPERVAHNDTKINNVLFDARTGRAACVIDLDTVMPGLALHDFGDMARAGAGPVNEDETDLSKVELRLPLFEAMARGYLAAAGASLAPAERALMPFSVKLMALEVGARFLTDHLEGDAYFKIHRPDHNLDRARAQLKLVESVERLEPEMRRLAESAVA